MRHVEVSRKGTFTYRRRVPKAVSAIITKREFKQKLGDSEREALAAWPKVHAAVEREIAEARQRVAVAEAAGRPEATEREAYEEAKRRRDALAALGVSPESMELEGELLLEDRLTGKAGIGAEDWQPVGVAPLDRHYINLLRIGPERYRPPEPTLQDALRLYLREHLREGDPATDSRAVGLAKRVVGQVVEVMGKDPLLASLTREDARRIRDHMLDRVKITRRKIKGGGRGQQGRSQRISGDRVSPATVSRELSIVSAIVSYGAREFGLPASFQNPFQSLPIAGVGRGKGEAEADKRQPLPPEVLATTRARIIAGANPQLALVWRMLEGTGCRLILRGLCGVIGTRLRCSLRGRGGINERVGVAVLPVPGEQTGGLGGVDGGFAHAGDFDEAGAGLHRGREGHGGLGLHMGGRGDDPATVFDKVLGGNLGAGSVAHRGAHLGPVFLCPAGEGGGFVTVGDLDGKGVAHGLGSSG